MVMEDAYRENSVVDTVGPPLAVVLVVVVRVPCLTYTWGQAIDDDHL
jgi:hypothetical protein